MEGVLGVLKHCSAFRTLQTPIPTRLESSVPLLSDPQILQYIALFLTSLKSVYLYYFQIVNFHPNLRMAHFLLLEVVEDIHSIQRNLEGII
jgi:hypothetical protein